MRHKRKQKLFIFGLLIFTLILSYIVVVFYFRNEHKRIYDSYNRTLKDQFEITVSIYSDMSEMIFYSNINTPEVLELLHQGYTTEDEQKKKHVSATVADCSGQIL